MRSTDERIREIDLRVTRLKLRKRKTETAVISLVSAFLFCTAAVLPAVLHTGEEGTVPGKFGSLFLLEEADPFIVIALAGFAAGTVVTIILKKWKERREKQGD